MHTYQFEFNAGSLRLIDANANRAREGIRTAEDYMRFSVGDPRWTSQLKQIRHGVTAAIGCTGLSPIEARNVATDPLNPEQEAEQPKISSGGDLGVAQRGLKRAQEAVRVLEEYLREQHPKASGQLSELRYQLYSAEQWLVCNGWTAAVMRNSPVYVLMTAELCRCGLMETAGAILKGGVKLLQLREKGLTDGEYALAARDLRKICAQNDGVLFCNDRADLALSEGADGVHLGQTDLTPPQVRRFSGNQLLIGRSTHSIEQARRAVHEERADYIAIGSMYDTKTKAQRVIVGPDVAKQVCAEFFDVPVFAIGGISLESVQELRSAGVKHIAVSSAVISNTDPQSAARRFVDAMCA